MSGGVRGRRRKPPPTQSLQTKASGGSSGADLFFGVVSNLISFYMDYELFGDELSVSFNGKEFLLIRE